MKTKYQILAKPLWRYPPYPLVLHKWEYVTKTKRYYSRQIDEILNNIESIMFTLV